MDAAAAARAWVDGWRRAWLAKDADAVAALYTGDAVFRSHPFRDPQAPREYAAWAFADEDEELVELEFSEPLVGADGAAVEYWAIVRRRDGSEATLAGISTVRFADDGRAREQRDYWALQEGRSTPNFK
jgi:ketosteroid isomerase-like protein